MTEVTPVAIKLAEELGFARSGNELIIMEAFLLPNREIPIFYISPK